MSQITVCVPLREADQEALAEVKRALALHAPGVAVNTASAMRFALSRTAAEAAGNGR